MDLVTGAIGKLAPMLVDLLNDEYKLQKGVKVQVKSLSRELESVHAALSKMAEVPPEELDPQVLLWARDVREASYDMVDILDIFRARIEGVSQPADSYWVKRLLEKMGKLFSLSKCIARREIAGAIEDISRQLKEVTELRSRYTLDSILGRPTAALVTDNPRPAAVYEDVTRLVGVNKASSLLLCDDYNKLNLLVEQQQITPQRVLTHEVLVGVTDMMDLVKWVARGAKEMGVLSILGFGGAGKTLIAKELYSNLGYLFKCRAMTTVPLNSDPEVIIRDILSQVKPHAINEELQREHSTGSISRRIRWPSRNRDVNTRQNQICELNNHLEGTRYLLVIDDVWSSSTWLKIWNCLPKNDEGSRVIVTTRFEAVAKTSLVDDQKIYKMPLLSRNDSKELFYNSLEGRHAVQMNQVPSRVWEMCGGLPLPIVTMAGLVASAPLTEQNEWIEVCESLFPRPQVCHKPEEFMRIINYCCSALPSDLKTCSLYLCLFPKGCKIRRKQLIRRFIAEGFAREKQGFSVEDIAETCFNQLVERKIIQPIEHSCDGKVKRCQVHNMVLEYIISKAAKENFATVVGGLWSMTTPGSHKVRRLALHNTDSKRQKEEDLMNLSHLRSLTVFGSVDHLHLKSFKDGILQVLDLEGCEGFNENRFTISDICKMTLLKYLNLRGTDVKKLPSNIGDLKYLETLDIRETMVREMPPSVGQLERIRNLLGGDKGTRASLKVPREIKGTAKTLQILSGVELVEASELNHFTGLRKLAIYKLPISDQVLVPKKRSDQMLLKDLISSIQYLSGYYLQSLVIDVESSELLDMLDAVESPPIYLTALELSGRLVKIPKWLPDLSKLVKLTLSATALHTDNLKLLSKLRALFSLTFSLCTAKHDPDIAAILEKNKFAYRGEIFVPAGGFLKLKLLRIFIPHLPSLNFSEGAMSALERFELCFKRLEGLHGMDKLESIHDVIMTVDGQAEGTTKMILGELKEAKHKYALNVKE